MCEDVANFGDATLATQCRQHPSSGSGIVRRTFDELVGGLEVDQVMLLKVLLEGLLGEASAQSRRLIEPVQFRQFVNAPSLHRCAAAQHPPFRGSANKSGR